MAEIKVIYSPYLCENCMSEYFGKLCPWPDCEDNDSGCGYERAETEPDEIDDTCKHLVMDTTNVFIKKSNDIEFVHTVGYGMRHEWDLRVGKIFTLHSNEVDSIEITIDGEKIY